MRNAYRDELEAALRRADELEQANAALATRNAELQGLVPVAPKPPVEHGPWYYVAWAAGTIVPAAIIVTFFETVPIDAMTGGIIFCALMSVAVGLPLGLLAVQRARTAPPRSSRGQRTKDSR